MKKLEILNYEEAYLPKHQLRIESIMGGEITGIEYYISKGLMPREFIERLYKEFKEK